MTNTGRFLGQCQKLKERGILFEISQGSLIARGFADLGFEEFSVLSSGKIVSLYTGNISSFSNEEERHFFAVPSCDMMIEAILKRGFEVISAEFVDQRKWRVAVRNIDTSLKLIAEEDGLEEAWLHILLATADGEQNV